MISERKFRSLPIKLQHKKAAELIQNNPSVYNLVAPWMDLKPLDPTPENLSHRFHHHLSKAEISLKEHNLLITKTDTPSSTPYLPIAIYLDHLRSGHNIGSILRTTETFRLGTVHFSEDTPYIDNKKVADASMGTSTLVPTINNSTLTTLPKPLIALETAPSTPSIHDFTFPSVFTLLLGNEEYGLSESVLEKADITLQIPLQGSKNSLNVACAFAIVAAEIRRQISAKSIK